MEMKGCGRGRSESARESREREGTPELTVTASVDDDDDNGSVSTGSKLGSRGLGNSGRPPNSVRPPLNPPSMSSISSDRESSCPCPGVLPLPLPILHESPPPLHLESYEFDVPAYAGLGA